MAVSKGVRLPPGRTFLTMLVYRIVVHFLVKIKVSSVELTERDEYVLRWIAEQYTVRFDTLQKLLGRHTGDTHEFPLKNRNTTGVLSERNTRRQINRWRKTGKNGLANFEKFHRKQKGWVYVTPEGLEYVELPYSKRFKPTFRSKFNHYHVLNELRLSLEDQYGDRLKWGKSDRRLHYEYERLSRTEKNQIHVVDGEIEIDGQLIAIQAELSRKVDHELSSIIFKLKKQYQHIWYFVNDKAQSGIEQAVSGSSQFGMYHIHEYGILEADEVAQDNAQEQETEYIPQESAPQSTLVTDVFDDGEHSESPLSQGEIQVVVNAHG